MGNAFKYGIIIAVMAVLMGVFAGILAATVDLSLLRIYYLPIMATLVLLIAILMVVAYKKRRIPNF